MALFKKSSPGKGLFKSSTVKTAKRYGSSSGQELPSSDFPTSEDLRRGQVREGDDPGEFADDPDTRFLHGDQQDVVSSNVAWLRYERGTLHIGYSSGGIYYCAGVDQNTALEIRHAPSVGHALKELERTHGRFTKVS